MADYNSVYTGTEIDAAIALAQTSRQPGDTGWGNYTDTQYTSGAPFLLSADTNTQMPNNKGNTLEVQKPPDVTTFYTGSVITGRNGDDIIITINFVARPTSVAATSIEVWFDIGGAVGELYRETRTFPKGTGIARSISLPFSGYTLDTWQANGATVFVRSDGPCDLYDINYIIKRTHKAR